MIQISHRFLNKLARLLHIDVRYFLRGSFWLGLSQGVTTVKLLIVSIVLARSLSVADFGLYAYIVSIFILASVFGAPGMSVAILQSVSRGYRGTFRFLTKKVLIWSLVGSGFLVGYGLYDHIRGSENLVLFLFLAFIFPFYSIGTNFTYYLTGTKEFRRRALYETIQNGLILFFLLIALQFTQSIFMIVVATLLPTTLINLWFIGKIWREAGDKVDPEAFNYGKKINWNYFVPTAKTQFDKILLANFLGYASTAVYNVATSIGEEMYALAKIVGTIIFPRTANKSPQEVQKKAKHAFVIIFILFLFLSIIGIVLAPYFIPLIYGQQYRSSVIYAQVILAFIPVRCLGVVARNIHESQKNTKILSYISNHLSILEIGLMAVGVFFFQLWGIIIVRIIVDLINFALQWKHFYHKQKCETQES